VHYYPGVNVFLAKIPICASNAVPQSSTSHTEKLKSATRPPPKLVRPWSHRPNFPPSRTNTGAPTAVREELFTTPKKLSNDIGLKRSRQHRKGLVNRCPVGVFPRRGPEIFPTFFAKQSMGSPHISPLFLLINRRYFHGIVMSKSHYSNAQTSPTIVFGRIVATPQV
jgi:hypothetical protein